MVAYFKCLNWCSACKSITFYNDERYTRLHCIFMTIYRKYTTCIYLYRLDPAHHPSLQSPVIPFLYPVGCQLVSVHIVLPPSQYLREHLMLVTIGMLSSVWLSILSLIHIHVLHTFFWYIIRFQWYVLTGKICLSNVLT